MYCVLATTEATADEMMNAPEEKFRCAVPSCRDVICHCIALRWERPRKAEIAELEFGLAHSSGTTRIAEKRAGRVDEKILWLDVAVHNIVRVAVVNRLHKLVHICLDERRSQAFRMLFEELK